jgi:hypothetical protein
MPDDLQWSLVLLHNTASPVLQYDVIGDPRESFAPVGGSLESWGRLFNPGLALPSVNI